jgi:hypothetical protein
MVHDPLLLRHHLDVSRLAHVLKERLRMKDKWALSHDAVVLLQYLCVTHDCGGFLSGAQHDMEQELLAHLRSPAVKCKLMGADVPGLVLAERLKRKGITLSPPQVEMASYLNDTENSVRKVLESGWYPPRLEDEFIFLLSNQDRPWAMRALPLRGFWRPEEMLHVFAIWQVAEAWAGGQSRFKPGKREDFARSLYMLSIFLDQAGLEAADAAELLSVVAAELADPSSGFSKQTVRLRGTNCLPVSDTLFLELQRRRVPAATFEINWKIACEEEPWARRLFIRLPIHAIPLVRMGILNCPAVLQTAEEIQQRCQRSARWAEFQQDLQDLAFAILALSRLCTEQD